MNSKMENSTLMPENNAKRPVHNLIILDESGSMQSIYHAALTGVNETLQTIRSAQNAHANQEHFVTLIAFDSTHYNQIYKRTAAGEATDITSNQYRPGGCTPLYDAMGRAITELHAEVSPDDVVLVTIITDGYENASQEYDCAAIRALVETMKEQNWVFTYIGANQDVEAVAKSMSINNHLTFETNDDDTAEMFRRENSCRMKFFGKINLVSPNKLSSNYFDDADA